MTYWLPLLPADLPLVFAARELEVLTHPDHAATVQDMLADVTAIVREAVSQKAGNVLAADDTLIPRTLRNVALDIVALRLLKRFSLTATEERRQAAAAAEEKLAAIRKGEMSVIDETGQLPRDPSATPSIIAPSPAYSNEGEGWWSAPNTQS